MLLVRRIQVLLQQSNYSNRLAIHHHHHHAKTQFHPQSSLTILVRRSLSSSSLPAPVVSTTTSLAIPEQSNVANQNLHPATVNALTKMNIKQLFPVQYETVQKSRGDYDLIVRSKTGSGKTLAFSIPVVDALNRAGKIGPNGKRFLNPRAIIITPTRELALQIVKVIEDLTGTQSMTNTHTRSHHNPYHHRGSGGSTTSSSGLKVCAVYGGVGAYQQMAALNSGVDIVVGTPGRLFDLYNRGCLRLSDIQFAVLDEADTMLDIGFIDAIRELFTFMGPKEKRRTMLFSATIPGHLKSLINEVLNPNPETVNMIEEGEGRLPSGVDVFTTPSIPPCKQDVLAGLLNFYVPAANQSTNQLGRALVFCKTQAECEMLATSSVMQESLHPSIRLAPLHGGMMQGARERALAQFRRGQVSVLVATDVAARGLDIPGVELVVHYDLPNDQNWFIHRTGRTARAGKKGTSVILFDPNSSADKRTISDLARAVQTPIFPSRQVPLGRQDALTASFSAVNGQPGVCTLKVESVSGVPVTSARITEVIGLTGLARDSSAYRLLPSLSQKDSNVISYLDIQLSVAIELEKQGEIHGLRFVRLSNSDSVVLAQAERRSSSSSSFNNGSSSRGGGYRGNHGGYRGNNNNNSGSGGGGGGGFRGGYSNSRGGGGFRGGYNHQ